MATNVGRAGATILRLLDEEADNDRRDDLSGAKDPTTSVRSTDAAAPLSLPTGLTTRLESDRLKPDRLEA